MVKSNQNHLISCSHQTKICKRNKKHNV